MSSFLEFGHHAFKIPFNAAKAKWEEASAKYNIPVTHIKAWGEQNFYLVFVEGGDNNMIDCDGKVARKWHAAVAGTWFDAFRRVCRVATEYVLGGCICFRTRQRWTKPENYILYYRKVMEQADEALSLLDRTSLSFEIPRLPTKAHCWQAEMENAGRLTRNQSGIPTLTISAVPGEGIADICWLLTECTEEGEPHFQLTTDLKGIL